MAVIGLLARCTVVSAQTVVSGVVRDAQGTPQMGALVELLSADATRVATAFTDQHGRYLMQAMLPGRYSLRATAAFFMPALRPDLRLRSGGNAVVNLTLTTLFEVQNWLPAQRRQADEPADDWKWTLRSTANRPLLRLVDPDDGVLTSSSAESAHKATEQARLTVTNGDGAFGVGGMHQVLVLDRAEESGDSAILRADIGNTGEPAGLGPSVVLGAGYERRLALGGSTRILSSFQSHPELRTAGTQGFQVLRLANTQQIVLGDAVIVDAGTLLAAERLAATELTAQPFVRVAVKPEQDLVIEYRYAAGRELQSSQNLDQLKPALNVMADAQGKPLNTRGNHNEISVSRKLGSRTVSLAVFNDSFENASLAGSGLVDHKTLEGNAMIADPVTGTFHLTAAGYTGRGMSATVAQSITPSMAMWVEYDLGTALTSGLGATTLADVNKTVTPERAEAVTVAVRGKVLRSGTSLKAEYRWQPTRTLTAVNAYNTGEDEAYLSFYLRQRLHCGRFLPQGLDAIVEATNLLEQGYQPVLAADGHTLFLAQVPRSVQGGLAFNF
jgi:hypothetical protein